MTSYFEERSGAETEDSAVGSLGDYPFFGVVDHIIQDLRY